MSLRLKSLGEEENDSSFASPLGVREIRKSAGTPNGSLTPCMA